MKRITFISLLLAMTLRAQTSGPVKVSGGVMSGRAKTKVIPTLSESARCEKVSHTVLMHLIVGKDGLVKSASIVSGPEMLRQLYIDSFRKWVFEPYLINGQPVEVETTIGQSTAFGAC